MIHDYLAKYLGDFKKSGSPAKKAKKSEYFEPGHTRSITTTNKPEIENISPGGKKTAQVDEITPQIHDKSLRGIFNFLVETKFTIHFDGLDIYSGLDRIDAAVTVLKERPGWEEFDRSPIVDSVLQTLSNPGPYWKQRGFRRWLDKHPAARMDIERELGDDEQPKAENSLEKTEDKGNERASGTKEKLSKEVREVAPFLKLLLDGIQRNKEMASLVSKIK
jgi:hypothetical protein